MEQVALSNGQERGQIQSVLLLTDGLANHGITSKTGILKVMEQMQKEGLEAVQLPPERPRPPRQQRRYHNTRVPQPIGNNLQQQVPELQVPTPAEPTPEVNDDSKTDSTTEKKDSTAQKKVCVEIVVLCV